MIGAAGTGSRLGVGIPKCLVTVEGKSIIDHQLDLLDDVEDVRVVVGFREEQVVRHVSARRPDAIFVRNPDYTRTTTLHSLRRAAAVLDRPFLALDGDLLVEPSSFRRFMDACEAGPPLVGICEAGTTDAVFVTTEADDTVVTAFHRSPPTAWEWSGPAFVGPEHLAHGDGYVYESLEVFLPLRAQVVDAVEVDTPDDLERARPVVAGWAR